MFIQHQIQPESQTQRQNNDPGHPQSLSQRTPRQLAPTGNPSRLACISNLRDAQTNNRDRAQYSAPRRPRIPSYISTMSNNKKARVTALPLPTTFSAASADRAYTQPAAQCQILCDNYFKIRPS